MQIAGTVRQSGLVAKKVERILVNVTPVTEWLDVVEYAIWLAGRFEARLYAVDVINDPFGYAGWNLPMPSLQREYQKVVDDARNQLQAITERERAKGFVIESLIREGDPVEQITRIIKEEKIDLLIMPAHEEDRVEHFLFGRENHQLVRSMPCSILLVKQPLPGLTA